ncbi:hypothetical protein R5R35_006592 [Gryllus longicercus]|uniref:Ribosomal protein 63, mitochondrial n=1 Tax=Gryllus longicercus TaxID=2509291 RepID=A0AAN9VUP1_9ORTH
MRLTAFLLVGRPKLPRGHLYRGKYRLVKEVTPLAAANLRHDYAREEKNMLYLRHPYLTLEQSCGHTKHLCKPSERFGEILRKQLEWKRKHVTIEERLRHLRVRDCWD